MPQKTFTENDIEELTMALSAMIDRTAQGVMREAVAITHIDTMKPLLRSKLTEYLMVQIAEHMSLMRAAALYTDLVDAAERQPGPAQLAESLVAFIENINVAEKHFGEEHAA